MPDPLPDGPTAPSARTPAVRAERTGPVVTLTLDRPEQRNALSAELLDDLGDALATVGADPDVRVVVLTHAPPAFCAGADLRAGGLGAPPGRHDLGSVLAAIQDCPKPVLARVLGPAAGGGVGLAAACDLSVASEDTTFGFSEVRLGVAPSVISVVCLPKLSRADALELFLTGERFTATRAAAAGLVTAAVPAAEVDQTVERWIDQLLHGAPGALRATKRLVYADTARRNEALRARGVESAELFRGAEAEEGMAAFRERRPARWVEGWPASRPPGSAAGPTAGGPSG